MSMKIVVSAYSSEGQEVNGGVPQDSLAVQLSFCFSDLPKNILRSFVDMYMNNLIFLWPSSIKSVSDKLGFHIQYLQNQTIQAASSPIRPETFVCSNERVFSQGDPFALNDYRTHLIPQVEQSMIHRIILIFFQIFSIGCYWFQHAWYAVVCKINFFAVWKQWLNTGSQVGSENIFSF